MSNRYEIPTASDFGKIHSFLARNGVSQADITSVIGNNVNGRNREEVVNTLRDWMKTLPRG